VTLDTQKKKPRWAHAVVADVTGELKEGASVALYFRQRDGTVLVAYGEVVKALKDGTVKIRIPWFVAASLAEWAGMNVGKVGGRIELYECAVQLEILEETAEEGGGRGLRIKQVAEDD
jgi:hypothetical protein